MRPHRYILLLLTILIGMAARGQGFKPDTPAEPNAAYRLRLACDPVGAATLTGAGAYVAGKNVSVKATAADTKWEFVNWTNSMGAEISKSLSFTYRMGDQSETLTAHFHEVKTATLKLKVQPESAGKASGEGLYREGEKVSLSVSQNNGFVFVGWKTEDGTILSSSRSFSYTTTGNDTQLTAQFRYEPNTPAEPNQTKSKHRVYLESQPSGGSFNRTSGFVVEEGASYSVTAYNYNSFTFKAWLQNGETLATTNTYNGIMGTEDVHLTATYSFNPNTPNEPSQPDGSVATIYGMASHVYRGLTAIYPIILENNTSVKELNFLLELPKGLTLLTDKVQGTARTYGFDINAQRTAENETHTSYVVSVSHKENKNITDNNGKILELPLQVTDEIEDGDVALRLSNAHVVLADGSTLVASTRPSILSIETLEEGDLQANFSCDRYLNRTAFTNLSTTNAQSYLWDFGDGESSTEENPYHVYAQAGAYNVKLTVKGIIKESTAEQTVIINAPGTWIASGDFTIDADGKGLRNFTSLQEFINILAQCSPEGDITLTLSKNETYSANAGKELATLCNKMNAEGSKLILKTENEKTAAINLLVENNTKDDIETAFAFIMLTQSDCVMTQINGASINTDVLNENYSSTICSNTSTTALTLSKIWAGEGAARVTATWKLTANATISGITTEGTGDLPAMTPLNNGNTIEHITYDIVILVDGIEAYKQTYDIAVRPLLTNLTLKYIQPANGTTLEIGNVSLQWLNPGHIAQGYTLTIIGTKDGNEISRVEKNIETESYSFTTEPGASYSWQIIAHGECDNLEGEVYSFTVKDYEYMCDADYEALKTLYESTNGSQWAHKWSLDSKVIHNGNWNGVTFDLEGNVTAINLQDNNLQGVLPEEGFTLPYLTSLNLSNNKLKGDVAKMVAGCPALQSLNLSSNQLTGLSAPLPESITSLSLYYQHNSVDITTLQRQLWPMAENVSVELSDIISYDHTAKSFNAHPTLNLYEAETGAYLGDLVYETDRYALHLHYDYKLRTGVDIRIVVGSGSAYGSYLRGAFTWLNGDANADNVVDVLDAQHTINYILNRHNGNFNYAAADTYRDNNINVQDLVATVNIFLNDADIIDDSSNETASAKAEYGELYVKEQPSTWLSLYDGALWMDASETVSALDITLQNVKPSQVALQLDNRRFTMISQAVQDGTRLVIVSLTGAELPLGQTKLLRVNGTATLKQAKASDPDARRLDIGWGNKDTDNIHFIDEGTKEQMYYDLSGRRVKAPSTGIYIRNGHKILVPFRSSLLR